MFIGRTNGDAYQSTQTNVFSFYVNMGFYYSHPVALLASSANLSLLTFFTEVKLYIPFTTSEQTAMFCETCLPRSLLNKKFQILPCDLISKSTLSIC